MAEYWKSAPRHWCKQCKIFIRDTAFEKTQHEASPKHQGNLKRFLRDIHKNNENQQRETQRAKSEVERLRKAVSGDSQSKDDKAPAPAPAKRAAPADKPVSAEDRKKQMAQLVEMGVAIPEEYRAEMALAGEWQTLSETKVESEGAKSIGVRKRKLEGEEDEEGNPIPEIVSRGWGSRMRTYPGAQVEDDDDGDLDALLASTKELKKPKTETTAAKSEETKMKPEMSFKIEGENADSKAPAAPAAPVQDTDGSAAIKTEQAGEEAAPSANPPSDEGAGVVFKKRKAKVMRK